MSNVPERRQQRTEATRIVPGAEKPAREVRGYTLAIREPAQVARTSTIAALSLRVGSRSGVDCVLRDPLVSRIHFEILAEPKGFRLKDLGSTNGTFLDGYRVNDAYMPDICLIRAGDTEIEFRLDEVVKHVSASIEQRFGDLVGESVVMREVFSVLSRAAPTETTVLLEGETGTGKELAARAIHSRSNRARGPFVVVDCGSLPTALFESHLFGHVRGAFSGAHQNRTGLFEQAEGGTLFLDDLGELPLPFQAKLLRAIEERRIRAIGATETIAVDVRLVAASQTDLASAVNRRAFREDLYFRLAVIRLQLPALRDRSEDVPLLVAHFLREALFDDLRKADAALKGMTKEQMARLQAHPWPGNVRELRNVIERSLSLELAPEVSAPLGPLAAGEVDLSQPYRSQKEERINQFDRAYLLGQLERSEGNVSKAARASGLERMQFKRLLKKCDS